MARTTLKAHQNDREQGRYLIDRGSRYPGGKRRTHDHQGLCRSCDRELLAPARHGPHGRRPEHQRAQQVVPRARGRKSLCRGRLAFSTGTGPTPPSPSWPMPGVWRIKSSPNGAHPRRPEPSGAERNGRRAWASGGRARSDQIQAEPLLQTRGALSALLRKAKHMSHTDTPAASRRIRLGMVGGGEGAFIGAVHRIAARLDDHFELIAGALSASPEKATRSAQALGLGGPARSYGGLRRHGAGGIRAARRHRGGFHRDTEPYAMPRRSAPSSTPASTSSATSL